MNPDQSHPSQANATSNADPAKILIVDDIPANLRMLSARLEPSGYDTLVATSGETALQIAARAQPDLILLDVLMPGIDGFETCRRLKADLSTADIPVIFVTAKGETDSVVQGFGVGGVDYIGKPFEDAELLARVETHVKINRLTKALQRANRELQAEIEKREQAEAGRDFAEDARRTSDDRLNLISEQEARRWGIPGFIGQSKTIAEILDYVQRLQDAANTHVLITGESGTGKELIARAIHFGSGRAKQPFIPLNCSAIPSELAESTLFGHIRGAFTGANQSRKGCFELADGGTLFLDEIGDMPLALQVKLLRVIEDSRITPVGNTHERRVNVRILAATNADLQEKIAAKTFREDLFFRLSGFTVTVPPLRERTEDIPRLVDHFLKMFADEMAIERPTISPQALTALVSYPFPGNVRQLKNII